MSPETTRAANLAHFLTKNAARLPDAPAILWEDRCWSWGALDARVSALAAGLTAMGLTKGDRVLVQMPNGNQITEIMQACFRLGAVWVPTNFRQTPSEIAYVAGKTGAAMMICGAEFADHARAAQEAKPGLRTIPLDPEYEDLIAAHLGTHVPNVEVTRDDPAWFFFTSGSTGRPKAVVLTHGQLNFTTVNHSADLMPGTTERDASLVVAPLSHGAGMHQLVQFATATPSVLMPRGGFSPAAAWSLVEQHRVSNMFTVPTIVKMLVEDPSVDRFDHSSLRHVIYAGAPMYREDQKTALAKLGSVLVQYYGLGEVTGCITVQRPEDHHIEDGPQARAGTCGVERMGLEVSIQDSDGRILGPGETGEICVIGGAVCAGYLEDPEANAKAFRNGWFLTGDLGHLDAQRYLFITGRASDMYISGGSNVYPREVEEVLLEHPSVSEIAILGVPDARWGEVGLAVCVADGAVDEGALRDHLDGRVARYKMPARYVFIEEMPKTAYGKITKKLVRAHLTERGLL